MGEGIRIDVATGDVSLDATTVGPRRSATAFEATPAGAAATRIDVAPGHVRYELPDVDDGDVRMRVHLYFEGEALRSLEICAVRARTDDGGWHAWSEDDERARDAVHTRWLAGKGASPGTHGWGRLHAGYDAKRGGSVIALHYDDTGTRTPRLPLGLADARRLAQAAFGAGLVIVDADTIERPWGWVFSATSAQHAASGSDDDMLIGLGCVGVDREDGSVHAFGSSAPPEHWADAYGRERSRAARPGRLAALVSRVRNLLR